MKKRIPFALMMKTPKETFVLIAFENPTAIWDIKNGGRSTIGCTRPQNNMSEKIKHQHSTHCYNRILHIACHLPHKWHTSDVCHLKPWFQYQALYEGPVVRYNVSLEKCTHEYTGPYIKVNTYTRNKHNSHSQTTQCSVTLMWTLSCYYSIEHI